MTDNKKINFPVTTQAASWVANLDADDIPVRAYDFARHAILDCIGCAIAGQGESAMEIMREEFTGDGCDGASTLIASGRSASLHNAALINGTAAHALDYDDVHFRLHGHPTACIAPATLALGEFLGASGRDVLTAFIIGTEVGCALGEMCDDGHYEAGFHATGTMGTFGAAAACARLMGLDGVATTHALSIAASQASGLKVNFGTMTKPYHAGKAAMNGLMAARLAARGFTASDCSIEGPQGFAQAQVPGFKAGPIRRDDTSAYAVEEMLYKYHAACYLTHSTLNAIQALRKDHEFSLDNVEVATLKVRSTHSSVCCIPQPASGLEFKFSIQHLAAMALDGVDTGSLGTYCTTNAIDERYIKARDRVVLDLCANMTRTAAMVTLRLTDGRVLSSEADVGMPEPDADVQWMRLTAKFDALVIPVLGPRKTAELIALVETLDNVSDIAVLMKVAG